MTKFSHFQKSIPVPMEFVSKYMLRANAVYVKVYLYGLLKCYEGDADLSNSAIADALDILETDVAKAWRYWKKEGLVHTQKRGSLVFDVILDDAVLAESEDAPELEKQKNTKVEEIDIDRMLSTVPSMKDTVDTAGHLLKKPLTRREITAIYNFMDWYAMSSEMIMILLEYCMNEGKTNFGYIEKIAESWHNDGITTLEAMAEVLERQNKSIRMQNRLKKLFGLERGFTTTECKYITAWVTEFSMTEAMIKLAYEKTVENTGKLAMPYMNTILKSWYGKGIKTPSQAANEEKPQKQAGKGNTAYQPDELAAYERMMRLNKNR